MRELLVNDGWWACRAAGSFGCADIVALKAGFPPRLVECKSTAGGPYEHFRRDERTGLASAARVAGAEAWLVWWPPRSKPTWIHEADWPEGARRAA